MHIEIQARDFTLTGALREYVERRLGFALSTRVHHIQRIVVRLSDANRPRGRPRQPHHCAACRTATQQGA